MSVSVAGGSVDENAQLVSAIHQSLYANGFTNVEIAPGHDTQNLPMLAQLRIINPELFDTKIVVGAIALTPVINYAPVTAPMVEANVQAFNYFKECATNFLFK